MQRTDLFSVLLLAACLVLSAGCLDEAEEPAGSSQTVVVLAVIDGDTLDVGYSDGRSERVRLLGVDTPETSASANHPFEYGTITDTDALADWGEAAKAFTGAAVAKQRVVITTDPVAGLRGDFGRLLAYVTLEDGTDLNAALLREGYARAYLEAEYSRKDAYRDLQVAAMTGRRGLWTLMDAGILLIEVHYDAQGDDRMNLNDEYVVVANTGRSPADLEEWTIAEEGGAVYRFDALPLPPGSSVTVHTGEGSDTEADRYWGRAEPVLNNRGDTVTLTGPSGEIVMVRQW
jgi:micrococcal nuclease